MDILDSYAMPTVILNLNLNLSYNDCSLIFVAVYTQMRCQPISTSSPPYRKISFLVGHKLNFLKKKIYRAKMGILQPDITFSFTFTHHQFKFLSGTPTRETNCRQRVQITFLLLLIVDLHCFHLPLIYHLSSNKQIDRYTS